MTKNTHSGSVAWGGAVLQHVVTPWLDLSGAWVNSALSHNPGPVVVPTNVDFVKPWRIAAMARPLAVPANGLPLENRKQYVHTTRVNVGGDGASGPHPEREPA